MAGTIIGTINLLTYLVHYIVVSIFAHSAFQPAKPDRHPVPPYSTEPLDPDPIAPPDKPDEILPRIFLFRFSLVMISNLFFIEWAYNDY